MIKNTYCKYILLATDLFCYIISYIIGILVIILLLGNIEQYIPTDQIYESILTHLFLGLLCVMWFLLRLRHYTYRKPYWFELKEILRTLLIFAVIELSIIAFSKLYFSRYLWVFTWGITFIVVPLGRIMIKKYLIYTRSYLKNTVIIGSDKNAIDAYYALSSESYLGLNIKYFISSNPSDKLKELGVPIINNIEDNILPLLTKKTDQFVIALEDNENKEKDYWLKFLSKEHYRFVSVIPTLRGLPLYSTDMSFLFSYDVILLRINNNLAKRSSRILKRTMDIFGSLFIILLLSPLLLTLYFLIKKDGGNAIYSHSRIGQNGKEFKCLKFRSMIHTSQEVLDELLKNDLEAKKEWETDFKLKNDPRITKLGNILRKTSLDELPQLFNVLVGQMSLVGPRPIVKEELAFYQNNIDYYFMTKPGMTGLWQVSGRNDVDYDTRVYFDSWYVKNWSLWNDIAILFKTINVVIKRTGAY